MYSTIRGMDINELIELLVAFLRTTNLRHNCRLEMKSRQDKHHLCDIICSGNTWDKRKLISLDINV